MAKHIPIADLARVIHPRGSKRRIMALLKAYFDASFTDAKKPVGVTSIGGYIGPEIAWQSVEEKWLANRDMWGLSEFSIAKILAGRTAVGQSDAIDCIQSFGKIVNDADLHGLSASISDQDWETAINGTERGVGFPTRYHSCLFMLFGVLSQYAKLDVPGEPIALVFDTDIEVDEAMTDICEEFKAGHEQIATLTFARRSQFPMIECADLCAGTERRSWISGGPFNPPDKAFEWFHASHAKSHRGAFWSLEEQRKIDEALAKREEWKRRREREGES